ncbi:MAG: Extracellular solute-binding protein family 1 [Verrucomicrobiales bacterium]|nr:Extracellular solute-binding protein family 1 [Verrucomicrobiales bacterium]
MNGLKGFVDFYTGFGRYAESSKSVSFTASLASSLICLLVGFLAVLLGGCSPSNSKVVTLYAAQDREYVQPIIQEFSARTGLRVDVVYDSEAVKTTALANRLLAERNHPQCDVFWNNEELRTRQLAAKDVFRSTNGWTSFGFRSRRMVINTNLLSLAQAPASLLELTNQMWRGKVALAFPLFGSTVTHFLALRQAWGETKWEEWCRALIRNKPYLLDGNSVVVRQVSRGEAWIGLTDSDDIAAGQREGMPVAALPLNNDSLLLPNTIAITRNAPHAANAQRLFEFLHGPDVAGILVQAHALESPASPPETQPETLRVNWPPLLAELKASTARLEQLFLR